MGVVCIIWLAEKIVRLGEEVTAGSLHLAVALNVCKSARMCFRLILDGLDRTC